jgi:pyruvate ferredoxin oxidoreductase beta subunit/2-oxoisovalerate ferredoxin oxidoreductase beta subunit
MSDHYFEFHDGGFFRSGHVACGGCVEALAMRAIFNTVGQDAIGVVSPSCGAIIAGAFPNSSMKIPAIHTTLEAAAATASGIKRALIAKGKPNTTVLCLAGDGGTYDIGLQALSSAVERNEDILYICFDNEGYMNTGAQKSSSTPFNAATTSTPGGKLSDKKNLTEILVAHHIPYVATASPHDIPDLTAKVAKAMQIRGTKVITILIPCLPGWGLPENAGVKTARLATQSGMYPLYEVEDGVRYKLNQPEKSVPVQEYLSLQKRFRHLSEEDIDVLQERTDREWGRLLKKIEWSGKEQDVKESVAL